MNHVEGDTLADSIYSVLEWAKREGDVKVIDRIRVKILPDALQEGVALANVDPATACSAALLSKLRDAASDVVGKPCPV